MVRIGSAISTLLFLAALPFSSALKFDLHAHTGHSSKYERCIRNFVAKDTLVLVTAIVSGQKGDGQMVNMHIKDAVGNEYGRPKDITGETRMAFTSHADAAFDVCFENQLTATGMPPRCPTLTLLQLTSSLMGAVMNPSKHIELDIDIGADARDWSAIQAQEKLKPVETELRRIEELVSEVVAEMDYLRTREQKLRDTNESTNERVKWFAFGTMGMLVGLGAWQVVYLRAYFRSQLLEDTFEIEFCDVEVSTIELFLVWLYGGNIRTPTTTVGLQHRIALYVFARHVKIERLANLCMDRIRTYYLRKKGQDSMVSTEEVKFLYDHTMNIKLRTLFALTLAIQAEAHGLPEPINASTAALLRQPGEFGVDWQNDGLLLLSGPLVTIVVGHDRKVFNLHRDLLCDRSTHFRAALLGHFQEAQTGLIEFPDEEETTIKLFTQWLYGHKLPRPDTHEGFQRCIALICFARSILLEELQNECMTLIRMYFRTNRSIAAREMSVAYDAVPGIPKLRLLVCLEAALQYGSQSTKELTAFTDADLFERLEQGGDFATDFLKVLAYHKKSWGKKVVPGQLLLRGYDCMFHNHNTSDTCSFAGKFTNDEGTALIVGTSRYLATKQTSKPAPCPFNSQVILLVGEKQTPFSVIRGLLCHRSTYFKAALQESFREAQSNEIELPDEHEDTVGQFCLWLEKSELKTPNTFDELKIFILLLTFARKILLEELSNLCIDHVRGYYYKKLAKQIARGYYWDPNLVNQGWPRLSADEIYLLYDHEVGTKLRCCLCLAAAVTVHHKYFEKDTFSNSSTHPNKVGTIQVRSPTPIDKPTTAPEKVMSEIYDVLAGGGEFSVDLVKLLGYYMESFRSIRDLAGIFKPEYNCEFHDHRTTQSCMIHGSGRSLFAFYSQEKSRQHIRSVIQCLE
ncbi:MAG: hypothetical protein Q9213_007016 [Squamulea squamosa]